MIKIAILYYGSKISPNKTRTPEGYLLCLNVPIARTGWQEYMPSELGLPGNIPVQLYRSEEEVFSPASIASYNQKPVTDEHPPSWITPDNISAYMRGVATNVRRGVDGESDLLLADLVIYDKILISEIEAGKKEVSCGYDYDCVQIEGEGRYMQTNIRGNHVAVCREGRAGYRVAVKDSKPKTEGERGKSMSKNTKSTIWGKMFKAFAVDAEPEELEEASKMMHGSEKEGKDEEPVPTKVETKDNEPTENSTDTLLKQVLEKLGGIEGRITALETAEKQEAPIKDALDELEAELKGEGLPEGSETGQEEESVTIEPEMLADSAPVSDPSSRPVNPIQGADSKNAVLMALKLARPIVNAIKDPVERKKAQDSMAVEFRKQLDVVPNKVNAYASMNQPAKAKDSVVDESEYGKAMRDKYNPHYNKKNK